MDAPEAVSNNLDIRQALAEVLRLVRDVAHTQHVMADDLEELHRKVDRLPCMRPEVANQERCRDITGPLRPLPSLTKQGVGG